MTDADWSFSLRSATGFFNDADSDDDNEETLGDTEISPRLSSSSYMLQQIDLATREDSAQYKPNPWSIARVNAASRPRQPTAAVNSVSEMTAAKKPPRGAIVDAFKKQAQKPKATTNPLAQDNRLQTPSQNTALTSAISVPDNLAPATARSPTPVAHITASAIASVPIPSQSSTLQQDQGPPLPPFLPEKAYPASYPRQSTLRSPNPHFAPSLERILPFSSPGPLSPHPQRFTPTISRPRVAPPQASAHFWPHISGPQATIPSGVHAAANHVTPGKILAHSSQSYYPVELERKTISSHPHQNTRIPPRLQSNQPIIGASPKSEEIPPSPSFAQARRFFDHGPPRETTIKQLSPEPAPPEEEEEDSHPIPALLHPRPSTLSRKLTDPYDQLPPSPDSEWSTLKPPARRVNGKHKLDAKSGKFRLPLSFRTAAPKGPPLKKARVVTYLPPPPPKMQKTAAPSDVETYSCIDPIVPLLQWFLFSHPTVSFFRDSKSDEWVTLPTTLRRNGSTELTHALGAIRFKWCVHPLQNRAHEDPSGTYTQRPLSLPRCAI